MKEPFCIVSEFVYIYICFYNAEKMSSSLLKCKIAIEGVKKVCVCVCVHECIHVHVYVCCYTFINVLQVYEQTELKIDPA